MRNITKRYGSLVANDQVDLEVRRGGIHAIVGENGAGKTTLMRIIYGLVQPDEGSYELDGQRVQMSNPAAAIAQGIGMVHQRFELVDDLSALENLVLGRAPAQYRVIFDRDSALERARELAKALKTKLDWNQPVKNLTVGARQRLEIMRLLYRDADTLIFDEPTSVLTPQEADDLFQIMRALAAEGRTIIFITHKLREVFAVAETVTVMRRGRVVSTGATAATDARTLSTEIVGPVGAGSPQPDLMPSREFPEGQPSGHGEQGAEVVLEVSRLTVADDEGRLAVRDATFAIHTGEILGVAGVEGNGQSELVETLVGLRRAVRGTIRLCGEGVERLSVHDRRRRGLAYISQDRDSEGASLDTSLAENVIAVKYDRPPLSRAGRLRHSAITRFARDILQRYEVRGGGPESRARSLSGGNLQRLVVGRETHEAPTLLVASHPTRGVDVRGIAFIHQQLRAARMKGSAVLLVSEELTELTELCDRLLVMFEGRIVADLGTADATPERLGALMTGTAA